MVKSCLHPILKDHVLRLFLLSLIPVALSFTSPFRSVALIALPVQAAPLSSATPISDKAYLLLNARVAANREHFFVYQDMDSGFNHGFPSGFFGVTGKVHLDTGCIDDPADTVTGCASDANKLDRKRGTVMRITFAPLASGEFAGINIEEPQNWGGQLPGSGYDLRGASRVVFDARSPKPGGVDMQFGVHQSQAPFIHIRDTWTKITISLSTLGLSGAELSNVNVLFTIATNDTHAANGATVLLDNIRFEPVPASQATRLGALSFPLATETFGVIPITSPLSGRVAYPPDQTLRNVTTIYESALVLLALLRRGMPEDLTNARPIADAFDYALHHDNSGDPLPAAPDGAVGLHNGYSSGDLALFNDQGPGQGQAGEIRLAGFSCGSVSPTGYCLILDGATGGNNAFAILALLAAWGKFGDQRYLDDARTIARWIVGNLTDNTGSGYGGYYVGYPDYPDEGAEPPKGLIKGKSVENNADIFAAFTMLATVEEQLGNHAASVDWTDKANVAGDFVMRMYDPIRGRFFAGTVPAETARGPGICPDGPKSGNDVINTCDFLDSNSFPTLAMAAAPRYRNQIEWKKPIQYIVNTFAQWVTSGNEAFCGFSITETPTAGPDGVAWEFTGQAIRALHFVGLPYQESCSEEEPHPGLGEILHAQSTAPFGDGLGLVASTLQDGESLPPYEQCLSTPFQCIPQRVGLAATTWAIFAEQDVNILYPVPSPPSLSSPSNGSSEVSTTPTLDWSDVAWATSYDVQVCSDSNCSNIVREKDVTMSQWVVSLPLNPHTQYWWRVQACNSFGCGPWSEIWNFTTIEEIITVVSPNGGETWPFGSTQTIRWTSGGVSGNVKIQLSRNGGRTWTTLIASTPNNGTRLWTVSGPVTLRARIRVRSVSNPAISDTGDGNFRVGGGNITVTSPNGGETWPIGSTQTIQWTSDWTGGNVKIEVSRNGGRTWTLIVRTNPNDGSYSWKVIKPAGLTARIRVSNVGDASIADMSNANFRIGGGSVTVIAPNGGEVWPIGSTQRIQWSTTGFTGNVKILISRNGGSTWTTLSSSTPNDGMYDWKVVTPVSTTARIRVSSVDDPSVLDISNANFTLGGGTITVTAPNGGETWTIGTVQAILWSSSWTGGTVKIELSRKGGTGWKTLASSTPNDRVHNWTVTSPSTSAARIRVSNVGDSAVSDMSDVNFTIQ